MAYDFNAHKKQSFTATKKPAVTTQQSEAATVLFLTAMEGQYGPYGIGSMTADELATFAETITDAIASGTGGKAMIVLAQNVNKKTGKAFYTLKVKPAAE